MKKSDHEIIEEIKQLFDASPEYSVPDEEMERFLDRRTELLQSNIVCSLEKYIRQFETLKEYGVEDKIMYNMEFIIRLELRQQKEEFLKSEFYKQFKGHKVVERVLDDWKVY